MGSDAVPSEEHRGSGGVATLDSFLRFRDFDKVSTVPSAYRVNMLQERHPRLRGAPVAWVRPKTGPEVAGERNIPSPTPI